MSIGFSFTGKVKKPETLIAAAKKLAEERSYGFYLGENGLNISLCPLDEIGRASCRERVSA